MGDRLLRGTLAGILSEIACIFINYLSKEVFHYAKHRWVEMLSYMFFGRPARTPIDWVLGYFLCFAIGGALGLFYAQLMVPKPDAGNYYFRAVALSIGFMLAAYAIGNLFKVPVMAGLDSATAVTTLLSATAWGLLFAYLMKRWDKVYV